VGDSLEALQVKKGLGEGCGGLHGVLSVCSC
jgi:hypothetical protein